MPLLPRIERDSAPHPTAAVIWLHGLGADGNDFANLLPELDLRGCAPIHFVFPHAPEMAVTINGGYRMPAWYDIVGADLEHRQDRAGIENSQRAIQALIDHTIASGIASEHIVLAGFSQGCAVALHTALRLPYRLAGVIGLSGYLPLADQLVQERHPANAQTPIFLGHGTLDPVVLPRWGSDTRDALTTLGYPVQWHTYTMEHSLHPQEIADVSRFLQHLLPAAQ